MFIQKAEDKHRLMRTWVDENVRKGFNVFNIFTSEDRVLVYPTTREEDNAKCSFHSMRNDLVVHELNNYLFIQNNYLFCNVEFMDA